MEIRNATMDDFPAIAAVEAACFPAAEAATAEEFAGRLAHYAGRFWLLFEQGELMAFVDGFCTDTPDLTDEMYADAALQIPRLWQPPLPESRPLPRRQWPADHPWSHCGSPWYLPSLSQCYQCTTAAAQRQSVCICSPSVLQWLYYAWKGVETPCPPKTALP